LVELAVIASELRMLATGLLRSWREHRVMMLAVWVTTAGLCIWAAAVGGLYYFQDFRTNGGPHSGAMTVISAFSLVAAGMGMSLVARRVYTRQGWRVSTLAWAIGGAGGLLLALDEITQIHEGVARRLARAGVPAPFGFGDRDLYVFATYGLFALFAVRGAWPQLRRWSETWLPGVASMMFFATSSLVDQVPWEGLTRSQQGFWGPVEEILKTLGTVSFAMFGLLLAEAAARDPDLASRLESPDDGPEHERRRRRERAGPLRGLIDARLAASAAVQTPERAAGGEEREPAQHLGSMTERA
jgi:hypothetical protein